MRKYGQIIKVKPEKLAYYKKLHKNPWPEVLKMIHQCNIRNYVIFHHGSYLFAYFEYVGENFEADMKKMAADQITQKWWKETDPCQESVEGTEAGEWWCNMEEVFRLD